MKVKTCLRYPGGKFYGLKKIRPFYNISHTEYREPFVGGGSVVLDKELVKINWINDLDKELIIFYKTIQNPTTRKQLYKLLGNEVANKERHKEILAIEPKNIIEIAYKYFYLNRTSFSGIMCKPRWGYALGSSVTPDRWTKIIEPVANKLKNIKITSLDFRKVITTESKNDVLLYLDPPYFEASKSIYKNEFSKNDHLDLCNILKNTKYKFILSYENCKGVKDLYNWANIYEIDFTYFMSEARRQNGKEIIITNF